MRIAQVVASYEPHIGGVETHVRRIAEACAAAGDEVTVLTHGSGSSVSWDFDGPVRIVRFPLTVRSARYPLSLPLFRYLAEHAAEFDVVHAHSYHTLVGHAAARSGLPFVFTPHYHGAGHTQAAALLHRAYRPAGAWVLANADAVVCVSRAEREQLARDFPAVARKIRVIPNGADPRPQESTGPGERMGRPLVLTVGRLERYKNVDLIIRALCGLATAVDLVVVGDGPDRLRLERLARTVGRVRFAGRVSDAELEKLLTAADVVASASDHEAFGLAVADGLAAGTRVVASAIPAHHEVGRLAGSGAPISFVDPRNTPEFTAALAVALSRGRPPAGLSWLPSWQEVADRTRDLYLQVGERGRVRHEELV